MQALLNSPAEERDDDGNLTKRAELCALLDTGGKIQVHMDEYYMLLGEVSGLEWTEEVQDSLSGLESNPESNPHPNPDKDKTLPTLPQLKRHIRSAKALRENLPLNSSSEKSSWVLDEEFRLNTIVQTCEEWTSKYREIANSR